MSNNNNNDAFDLFSIPCAMSCGLATSAIVMMTYMSYTMGTTSKDRGSRKYTSAYWILCLAMVLLSCAFAVVKVLE